MRLRPVRVVAVNFQLGGRGDEDQLGFTLIFAFAIRLSPREIDTLPCAKSNGSICYLCNELSIKEIVCRRLSCSVMRFFTSLQACRTVP